METARRQFFHALIRTHHTTSRTKVAKLKSASKKLDCYALLRSGGQPGLMYVESFNKEGVQRWVNTVHDLRYKDYQLASPPAATSVGAISSSSHSILEEVDTVKRFAIEMEKKNLMPWWRIVMGFEQT